MSDTPRTDAACGAPSNNWEATAVRLCECSMLLERENAALKFEQLGFIDDALRYQWLRRFDHLDAVNALLNGTEFNTLDAAVNHLMERENQETFRPRKQVPATKPSESTSTESTTATTP